EGVFSYEEEEQPGNEASVFEPLEEFDQSQEDVPVPAYAPEPVPSLLRPPTDGTERDEDENFQNPIARAMSSEQGGYDDPAYSPQDSPELDRVEAVTESSQKI